MVGQLLVALNFAEVSSHFPLAGSVYQWTKYLSNRHYSVVHGWIYLFAGSAHGHRRSRDGAARADPLLNLGLNIPSDSPTVLHATSSPRSCS